ncbi:ATP-binding protein [Niabella yanshanensis]|uniref:histidine kinase n=1 Tax=Niabella yanshanensis TaxID=577386 RepID=A0ABZ0W860_9BACT|nr:ATP-binding protein [Niabella yanshanensis]WQD37712.1 ATP-binding protein [Niabella yanshanensis]
MRIKAKLTIGVGLLFLMILLLALISGRYVYQLKADTANILKANYNTLEYGRNMLLALEDVSMDTTALVAFGRNLRDQQKNVTEPGERETTQRIADHFVQLQKNRGEEDLKSLIRKDISELMRLNMEAIGHKSKLATGTSENAIVVISVVGTLCFIIAFVLLINLPANIANPIKALTASIRQIADQHYDQRLHFDKTNEFGELAQSFNIMAEKLQEYSDSKLDKILKGKKRIETLINNMHDAVIGINEKRKVLFANDEALTLTGLRRENLVGKNIQDVAVQNDLVRLIAQAILQPGRPGANNAPIKIYADQRESYFEKEIVDINITPTGETEPQFIGQVIILKNITSFKELDIAKTNFIATVSHELKTPISSIKMGLQLLGNKQVGALNDEQQSLVDGIGEDAGRLLKITSELLNITQAETGMIQMTMGATMVEEIVQYAVQATKAAADQKQVKIELLSVNGLPPIMADGEKTAWVLTNLLSNAIRYTHTSDSIQLCIEQRDQQMIFSVKDHGPGIAPEFLGKIFERYFRMPGENTEGTGLGLTICRQFIEAQGGALSVSSELGTGSCFAFTLNIAEPQQV